MNKYSCPSRHRPPPNPTTRTASTLALVQLILLAGAARGQEAPTDDPSVVELAPVVVKGFVREYYEPATTTGLGLPADLFDTPLTLTTVPMDILLDQQVNNVEDALRNVAGVTRFKQGNGGEEKFSIRGFDASQSLYKDGARINNAFNASNIATTETANIERYDVLKGPAAILYGQGEPGGVINYITKKPLVENYGSLEAIVGSYDYFRGEGDFTGPLSDTFAYRMIGSYENSGSHRDFTSRSRVLAAPSLSWRPTEKTTLTGQFEYIADDYTQDRGQVLDGDNTVGFTYSDRLAPSQFFGVPGWNDDTQSRYYRGALLADHQLTDNSELSLRASLTRVDKELFDSSPRNGANGRVIAANGEVQIRPLLQTGTGESDTLVGQYRLTVPSGSLFGEPLEHKLLLQGDYERIFNDARSASAPNIVYNVDTRQYTLPPGGIVLGPASSFGTDAEQYGVVAQDLVSLGDQWHLLGGVRYTWFNDRDAGVDAEDFSPRVGLVYRPVRDVSFYGSWARGFVPTTATGFNPATGNGIGGEPLDPETTEQFELGARWAVFDGRLVLNAAIFELSKSDIAVTDPASSALPPGEQWSANLGKTRTRGMDFQAIGEVGNGFRLIGSYAYLDNELVSVDPAFAGQEGNRLPGIPEHSGSLWGVYEFQRGALEGLGLGLGVFAQTEVFISTENRSTYDAWVQLDAMAYYKLEHLKFQINVKNLTDETYNLAQAGTTTDSFAAIRVGTSTPITVSGSVSLEF